VHSRWRFATGDATRAPFVLVPAASGIATGGGDGIAARYGAYLSPTTRAGLRVPVLYLRTTHGAAEDFRFDANFDVTRRSADRPIADDALAHVLDHARNARVPVLVTLNGGIWSDAAGSEPDWDATDHLEQDAANCQWNERDAVMPDDHLKHLPGSHAAPELARALTLNVHAHEVRRYKRRNLEQAAAHLVAFLGEAPDLLIGVNLDPDVYINPFFSESQWYDYNPGTLRQFREWLAASGPYADAGRRGAPDLSGLARDPPLALREVCSLAQRHFATWDDVDPPRRFSRDIRAPFWKDPWVREWEVFRRHLVSLHYDELAQWLVEAGLPRERIWSSQGLMAPADDCMPLALTITSPVKNYDSAGVSIAGSKPRDGHLGAIVYGAAATNDIAMENGSTLFSTLAALDDEFAVVEFNTADLRHPERRPDYAAAYRAWRDLWNAGARFVSPMAWNGSNGLHADDPSYVSFTAWRNTPLEHAARDFLLARSGLPRGSKLWTFGTQAHADDDGWIADAGALTTCRGALRVTPDANRRVALHSPTGIALAGSRAGRIVLGLADDAAVVAIDIAVRTAGDGVWHGVASCPDGAAQRTEAGRVVAMSGVGDEPVDQLRIVISFESQHERRLTRVAVLAPARTLE
ncbi:MAG: hypothetical protein ABI533_05670, partial [Betaproteobacteria bacterium]